MATSMPVADYTADKGFSERDDLGGLNLSDVPAVFLGAGNMRNASDAALLPAFLSFRQRPSMQSSLR
jgi:N-acetylmuramoyl-L-alanine amidase